MRAFFCLPLPLGVRAQIARTTEAIRQSIPMTASWVRPDNYHITLRFLGEIDPLETLELDRLTARVSARSEAFSLDLDRIGAFPSIERARVLWIGGATPHPFRDLVADLNDELSALGFPEEPKVAQAHVTVARIKSAPHPALGEVVQAVGPFRRQCVDAATVILMESRLGAGGAEYVPLFERRLGRPSGGTPVGI